jgi:hypothetical protein
MCSRAMLRCGTAWCSTGRSQASAHPAGVCVWGGGGVHVCRSCLCLLVLIHVTDELGSAGTRQGDTQSK